MAWLAIVEEIHPKGDNQWNEVAAEFTPISIRNRTIPVSVSRVPLLYPPTKAVARKLYVTPLVKPVITVEREVVLTDFTRTEPTWS